MGSPDRRLDGLLPARAASKLRGFRRAIERALPGRVDEVMLFGSRARGEARSGSDYDVAVFIRNLTERRPVTHLLADNALPYIVRGFRISAIAVPSDFLDRPSVPLAFEIARDGVPVP